jgi:hypothetical protein
MWELKLFKEKRNTSCKDMEIYIVDKKENVERSSK